MYARLNAAGALIVSLVALAACGGGGGDGTSSGSGQNITYAISVTPTTVALSGLANATAAQNVSVTFNGEFVAVGALPGQVFPSWLDVSLVSLDTTSGVIRISNRITAVAGNYSTTLRFHTGKDGFPPSASTDVTVTLNLQPAQGIDTDVRGLGSGNSLSARFNGGASIALARGSNRLGVLPVGNTYSVEIAVQPPGQHCTFDDGTTSLGGIVGGEAIQHRISCNAALLPWTWVSGSKEVGEQPSYPAGLGQGGPGFSPGGRMQAATARDAAGNLWIFGGQGPSGLHNDLWKLDVSTQQWTWVSGSAAPQSPGNYGTINVSAATNAPGGRRDARAWIDAAGNFWLYGGQGFSPFSAQFSGLNDLWVYEAANGRWTWVGGRAAVTSADQLGVYGTTPSTTNIPGARTGMAVTMDSSGAIWLFGGNGSGVVLNAYGSMDDLWKFDPATRVWSWIRGSDRPGASSRVQGLLGVPDPANNPGRRSGASLRADASGNLWMFGGDGPYRNDLWRFNTVTHVWTWMGGADTGSESTPARGSYILPGSANGNYPASREEALSTMDAAGNFWLFGGRGVGTDGEYGTLNDLWKYSPATSTWTWFSGGNEPGMPASFGTQGSAATNNAPPGRTYGALWFDAAGRLWMWGGQIAGSFFYEGGSDLWSAEVPP